MSRVYRAVIPDGLVPGDHFIVNIPHMPPITVCVPANLKGGSYIDISSPLVLNEAAPISSTEPTGVPTAASTTTDDYSEDTIQFDKACLGSALLGGILGCILCGNVGAIFLGGGAACVAKTQSETTVGKKVHEAGKETCNCILRTQKFVAERIVR
jgi:hypothetical protein